MTRQSSTRSRSVWKLLASLLTLLVAVALTIVGAGTSSASQGTSFQVAWTHIGIYPKTSTSMTAARAGAAVSDGTWVNVLCEQEGESVTSDIGTSSIWEKTDIGWLPNSYVYTGVNGWTPGVPRCQPEPAAPQPPKPTSPAQKYDRASAVEFAKAHWNDAPLFGEGSEDCTWFASEVLWAGRLPESATWTKSSWDWNLVSSKYKYPGPTKAATLADALKNELLSSGRGTIRQLDWRVNDVPDAQLGDLILYDWGHPDSQGNLVLGADGVVDHIMVVTSMSGPYPNVTGHTTNTKSTGWTWSPATGSWWESGYASRQSGVPRVYLMHITY